VSILGADTIIEAVTGFVGKFFGDKTAEEQANAAQELQTIISNQNALAAQAAVDQAEASSPDRINHWRGALGWVCVIGLSYHFALLPMAQYLFAVAVASGWMRALPIPPDFQVGELENLVTAMLGIATLHAAPAIVNSLTKGKTP
jgi:hypothetical protein